MYQTAIASTFIIGLLTQVACRPSVQTHFYIIALIATYVVSTCLVCCTNIINATPSYLHACIYIVKHL